MRFLPKSKLKQRLESLEQELGLFYVVDNEGFPEHKQERTKYRPGIFAEVEDLQKRITKLEEPKKGKK